MAYAFGCLAGLRRSEIAGLTWGDVKLSAIIPFIQLRDDLTKNGKADALPIHPHILTMRRARPQGMPAVKIVTPTDMKTMVKDLRVAGFTWWKASNRLRRRGPMAEPLDKCWTKFLPGGARPWAAIQG